LFLSTLLLIGASASLHAQRLNEYVTPPVKKFQTVTPSQYANTAVLTPLWTYQLQPVVTRMEYGASPAMVNLGAGVNTQGTEPDSYMEFVTGSDEYSNFYPELNSQAFGIWRCFDATGNVEWARDTKSDEAKSSIAFADIDYNLQHDLAGGTTSGWCLEVMNRFGSWTPGVPDASWTFPYEPQRNGSFMWHSSPAIGELITGPNHEGLEIVGGNNPMMSIWALDGDNTDGIDDGITADLTNWNFPGPTGTEGTDWDVLWVYQTNGSIIASPAIGDVDGDGLNEVVCGSKDNNLYCLNGATGALKWSFPTGNMITSSAGLADFDNNGKKEIVVGSQDGSVYFIKGDLNNNGAIDSTEFTWFVTMGPVLSSPAIADFDSDGVPDVIIGSDDGKIYGLLYSPSTNSVVEDWSYQTGGSVRSSAAVANSGRSQLTVYIGSTDSLLYILNGNGSLVSTFNAGGSIVTSPSVADIDGDHKLEIAFTAWATPDVFVVLRDTGSNVTAFADPWPMFRHDSRHTGCYTWTPPAFNCDAGVAEILAPDGSMPNGTSIIPKVIAHNYGESTSLNFTVTFEIRNAANTLIYSNTQTVPSLMADSSVTVSFPSLTATPGHFHTKAYTVLGCDGEPEDNVEYGDYEVFQSQWVEEFENTSGGCVVEPGTNGWQWGVPTSGPMAAFSGTKVWATILDNNYENYANWILNSDIYKAQQNNPVLSFYHWYDMEDNRDGGNLKLSINGGPFLLAIPVGGYPGIATWNTSGIPDQPCYNGVSGGWMPATFVLPVDSGQAFQVRWTLGSDNQNTRAGWYLDNLTGSGFGPGILVRIAATQIPCHGGLSTVTVTASGGTPPYTGTGVFLLPAGTHSFTITDASGLTGSNAITLAQPDQLISAIVAEPTPCTGVTSTLNCNVTGGTPNYYYYWSDGSYGQSLYNMAPGAYSVTVTDVNSCTDVANIVVDPAPATAISISASANPANTGETVTFTAMIVNGGTSPFYYWTVNGLYSGSNSAVFTYTPVDGDEVQCTLYAMGGCNVASNIITMSVGGLPANLALQNLDVQNNEELCYNATEIITVAGGGTTFNVYSGGYATMIAGQKIRYLPGTKVYPGGKMKGQISSNGEYCGNKSAIVSTAGQGDENSLPVELKEFKLYPNPTSGNFILEMKENRSGELTQVEIFNVFGEKVQTVMISGEDRHEFNFTGKADGLYFVKISSSADVETIKLIKRR
jgi:hypothetical protein